MIFKNSDFVNCFIYFQSMTGKIKRHCPVPRIVVTQVASAAGLMILLQLLFLRILPAHEFSWYRYLLELLSYWVPFILFPKCPRDSFR